MNFRNVHSAVFPLTFFNIQDYFIFPDLFDFSVMKDAVIGRAKIDNYLLSLMNEYHGYLIDTTEKG